jgi:hypothetical protein
MDSNHPLYSFAWLKQELHNTSHYFDSWPTLSSDQCQVQGTIAPESSGVKKQLVLVLLMGYCLTT